MTQFYSPFIHNNCVLIQLFEWLTHLPLLERTVTDHLSDTLQWSSAIFSTNIFHASQPFSLQSTLQQDLSNLPLRRFSCVPYSDGLTVPIQSRQQLGDLWCRIMFQKALVQGEEDKSEGKSKILVTNLIFVLLPKWNIET